MTCPASSPPAQLQRCAGGCRHGARGELPEGTSGPAALAFNSPAGVLHHPDDDPLGGFGLPKPRGLSDFAERLARWHNRVIGYAVTLVTDSYPRFRLAP